jgi:hypothetical protein
MDKVTDAQVIGNSKTDVFGNFFKNKQEQLNLWIKFIDKRQQNYQDFLRSQNPVGFL